MTRRIPTVVAVLVFLAAWVPASRAACPFPHPKKATQYRSSLVQGFTACTTYPDSCCQLANTTTEGGLPACRPPATEGEYSGNPATVWRWGPQSSGTIAMKTAGSDLAIALSMSGVVAGFGPADGTGRLGVLLSGTIVDPMNGAMTMVWFPVATTFDLAGGKVKLKTTLGAILAAPPFNGLLVPAPCTSFEMEGAFVNDPDGALFATPGIYLPIVKLP